MTALNAMGALEPETDGACATIRHAITDGRWLLVTAANRDAIASAVNELSNDSDNLAQEERDRERASWYRADSRALAALYGRILRAEVKAAPLRIAPACGSGWTGDRCTRALGHGGDHSNQGGNR
jgi:hypothetical protein